MNIPIEAAAAAARRNLVARLTDEGELPDTAWREVFGVVPRHVFVPRFYAEPDYRIVDGATASDAEEWLAAVYSDTTLITAITTGDVCSSSTMPSLVAYMLQQLAVKDGHRVLQVGTGTGYTAALLSQRLGATNVTSIDVEPELTAAAVKRLETASYRPTVITGDGSEGHSERAPYDRIMATCALRRIPLQWLAQVTPDARIVAPIRTGLAVIEPTGPHTAAGRFDRQTVSFMPMRNPHTTPPAESVGEQFDGESRPVTHGAMETHYERDFRFFLDLAMPDLTWEAHGPRLEDIIVTAPNGSAARLDKQPDNQTTAVTQRGPRKLWDDIEQQRQRWETLEKPRRERFGITINSDHQTIWLDNPNNDTTFDI